MSLLPSINGASGRDNGGRFKPGNRFGRGNPFNRKTARLRAALYAVVQPEDIKVVVAALVQAAKEGQPWAVRELLDRVLGRPTASDQTENQKATVSVQMNLRGISPERAALIDNLDRKLHELIATAPPQVRNLLSSPTNGLMEVETSY